MYLHNPITSVWLRWQRVSAEKGAGKGGGEVVIVEEEKEEEGEGGWWRGKGAGGGGGAENVAVSETRKILKQFHIQFNSIQTYSKMFNNI